MRNRGFKIVLLALAAAGGVVAWQRKNETPATPPALRPSEPFMDPAPAAGIRSAGAVVASPSVQMTSVSSAVDGGPAADAGVVASARSLPAPPHGPFTTAPAGPADDLKRISGVGPKLEELLNGQGITTFAQLASLTDTEVDDLQMRLPQFPGRIRRDAWVEQAARLQS